MRASGLLIVTAVTAAARAIVNHTSVATSPITFTPLQTGTANLQPCAIVSSSLAALGPSDLPSVPARVAYECLNSVKVDVDGDIQQIEELKIYLQWHTTFTYIKNPPQGYTEKPVDILAGLDLISAKVKNGTYKSEYAVQFDIMALLNQGYDNHLFYGPDIVLGVFDFQRPGPLVSVSEDGVAPPNVFVFSDLVKIQAGERFRSSPVKTINGRNATTYLSDLALQAGYHDVDARFNALFPNQALISIGGGYLGIFQRGNYDGPITNFTFHNGSSLNFDNFALVGQSFEGVDSGDTFFSKFCQGPSSTTTGGTVPTPTSPPPTAVPTATGYPEPVVLHSGFAIGGYFLDDPDFDTVAVLSIPTFEPTGTSGDPLGEFQDVAREFLATAVESGKTHLVIDLRGNGGGKVVLGFEIFKQLFPSIAPFGASRLRAHEAFRLIGAVVAGFVTNATLIAENPSTYQDIRQNLSTFNFQQSLDIDNQPWRNFNDYFGPHVIHGDNFTSVQRTNFSDPDSLGAPDFSVTGYLNNTELTPQPFEAENIVLLQDGFCSSTCAIFSELMKEQAKVESIAIGGRPINAPMQAIGGTKGSLTFPFTNILFYASEVLRIAAALDDSAAAVLNNTILGIIAGSEQLFKRVTFGSEGPLAQVNAADNLRKDDASQTPLEFVYEAADCKLFYTADMALDVTETWKAAAAAKWGDGGCVPGSKGDPSSISGGAFNGTN